MKKKPKYEVDKHGNVGCGTCWSMYVITKRRVKECRWCQADATNAPKRPNPSAGVSVRNAAERLRERRSSAPTSPVAPVRPPKAGKASAVHGKAAKRP